MCREQSAHEDQDAVWGTRPVGAASGSETQQILQVTADFTEPAGSDHLTKDSLKLVLSSSDFI